MAHVAIADNNPDFTSGGWVGGVDDSDGYVIVSDTTTTGLAGWGTGGGTGTAPSDTPTFWKSADRTDVSLLTLISSLPGSPGGFNNITDALNWLNSSNVYGILNYGASSDLAFILAGGGYGGVGYTGNENWGGTPGYRPAIYPGEIIFPNHATYDSTNDINTLVNPEVGVYINDTNYWGVDVAGQLNQLVGAVKTIRFAQGGNIAIFQTTVNSFQTTSFGGPGSSEVFNDGGGVNECTLIQAAPNAFVYGQLITVTIS